MTNYLFDTNVISELRKNSAANQTVRAWAFSLPDESTFISVVTLGEVRKGIELIRRRDPKSAEFLEQWRSELDRRYSGRILPITAEIADRWGRLTALRPLSIADSLLAATALTHDLTLVTRNTPDFQNLNLQLHNPWQ